MIQKCQGAAGPGVVGAHHGGVAGQGLAGRACPAAPAGSRAAPVPGTGHLPGDGPRPGRVVGWAMLSRAHGWAGPGCGELEAGPAVVLLGQGLRAPGGNGGSWAMGGGSPGAGQGQSGWFVPSAP